MPAARIDRQKGDVPAAQRVEYLAGGVEGDEFDCHAQPLGDFARKLRRNPARLAACRVLLRQHAIAEIDGRAQLTGGRELGDDIARNVVGHGTTQVGKDEG
jgi:hypothetical protein